MYRDAGGVKKLYIGSQADPPKLYHGTSQIDRVYRGSDQVWQMIPPARDTVTYTSSGSGTSVACDLGGLMAITLLFRADLTATTGGGPQVLYEYSTDYNTNQAFYMGAQNPAGTLNLSQKGSGGYNIATIPVPSSGSHRHGVTLIRNNAASTRSVANWVIDGVPQTITLNPSYANALRSAFPADKGIYIGARNISSNKANADLSTPPTILPYALSLDALKAATA